MLLWILITKIQTINEKRVKKYLLLLNKLFTCERFGGREALGLQAVSESELPEDGPEAVGGRRQLLLDRLELGHIAGLAGPLSQK